MSVITRLGAGIQRWSGVLALFLVVAGGTAYATHPGGEDTISSEDIINGQVKQPDIGTDAVNSPRILNQTVNDNDLAPASVKGSKVLDESLTGADLLDESLTGADLADRSLTGDDVFEDSLTGEDIDEATLEFVCPGSDTAVGDVCFGAVNSGDFATAEAACQAVGRRLPSVGEARLIQAALGVPATSRSLWTEDHTSQTTAINVFQNMTGLITDVETAKTQSLSYTCVRLPVRPVIVG